MHTIREITKIATMLAGLIAPRFRVCFVSASSQLCLSYVSATPRLRLGFNLLRALSLVTQYPSLCAQARNIYFIENVNLFNMITLNVLVMKIVQSRLPSLYSNILLVLSWLQGPELFSTVSILLNLVIFRSILQFDMCN